jgi:hypothetical protein
MRECVLRDFFLGRIPAAVLAEDIKDSVRQVTPIESVVGIEDMHEKFSIKRQMLVSLCDAAISGEFPSTGLSVVGFALMASDTFEWDDDLMSEVINDWSCPEINYPLATENVRRFKDWLLEVEPYPTGPQQKRPTGPERLVSVRRKMKLGSSAPSR